MKKVNIVTSVILIIFAIVALGHAGDADRVDSIIYNMSDEVYNEIKDSLTIHGNKPSDKQIAEFYINNY